MLNIFFFALFFVFLRHGQVSLKLLLFLTVGITGMCHYTGFDDFCHVWTSFSTPFLLSLTGLSASTGLLEAEKICQVYSCCSTLALPCCLPGAVFQIPTWLTNYFPSLSQWELSTIETWQHISSLLFCYHKPLLLLDVFHFFSLLIDTHE